MKLRVIAQSPPPDDPSRALVAAKIAPCRRASGGGWAVPVLHIWELPGDPRQYRQRALYLVDREWVTERKLGAGDFRLHVAEELERKGVRVELVNERGRE